MASQNPPQLVEYLRTDGLQTGWLRGKPHQRAGSVASSSVVQGNHPEIGERGEVVTTMTAEMANGNDDGDDDDDDDG